MDTATLPKTPNLEKEKMTMSKSKMKKPMLERVTETRTYYRGVKKTASLCGVSTSHLSYVMNGKRKAGRKLTARLKNLGVNVPVFETNPMKE